MFLLWAAAAAAAAAARSSKAGAPPESLDLSQSPLSLSLSLSLSPTSHPRNAAGVGVPPPSLPPPLTLPPLQLPLPESACARFGFDVDATAAVRLIWQAPQPGAGRVKRETPRAPASVSTPPSPSQATDRCGIRPRRPAKNQHARGCSRSPRVPAAYHPFFLTETTSCPGN